MRLTIDEANARIAQWIAVEFISQWKPVDFFADATAMQAVKARIEKEWWWRNHSPFMESDNFYWAGVCPKGATGWNGRMDIKAKGATEMQAVALLALLLITGEDCTVHGVE